MYAFAVASAHGHYRRSVCGHYRDALPVSSTENARRSKVHTHHVREECERGRAVLCVVIAAAAAACAVERVMREHEKLDVNDTNGLCTVRARTSSQFDRRARRDSALGLAGAAARTRPRMPGAVSAPKIGPCRDLAGLQNQGPTSAGLCVAALGVLESRDHAASAGCLGGST